MNPVARRHRSRPTTVTEAQPAPPPKIVLDHTAFPHIFDAIVAHAPWDSLKVLRQTSRSVCEQVDARIGSHILITRGRSGMTVTGTDGMPVAGFEVWYEAQNPRRFVEPTPGGIPKLLSGMANLVFGLASRAPVMAGSNAGQRPLGGAASASGSLGQLITPLPPREPLHIFRHTRVVDINDMFAPEDVEFLPDEITKQCTVRDLYRTEYSARSLFPSDVFVGSVELDDPFNMYPADDMRGVRRIVMTYFVPASMDIHNEHYTVDAEWDDTLREVIVMFKPGPEVEGPVEATYTADQRGLGALHGWIKFIVATKGRVTVSFVGSDELDGAFVGLQGKVSNTAIKDHIVSHVLASHPEASRDVVLDSIIVESYDERCSRIGQRQFALEDIRNDVFVENYGTDDGPAQ